MAQQPIKQPFPPLVDPPFRTVWPESTEVQHLKELFAARLLAVEVLITTRFEAADKATAAALVATTTAMQKAETASEKRLDSVNEFRAVLTDQQATFITRAEYASAHASLEAKLDAAMLSNDLKSEARHTTVSTRVDMMQKSIGERLDDLRSSRDRLAGPPINDMVPASLASLERSVERLSVFKENVQGRSFGMGALWTIILGALAGVEGVAVLVMLILKH